MKKLLTFLTLLTLFFTTGWAETKTVTLTSTNLKLTSSYPTSAKSVTVENISYSYSDLLRPTSSPYPIQAKASSGEIHNTTAYPGDITSVAITHSGTERSTTIQGSSDGTNWTQVATGSGSITGDFTGKGYKYFKITRGANVAHWTQIVITYEDGGSTPEPTYFSLTLPNVENGSFSVVDGSNNTISNLSQILSGTNITVTAIPNTGYTLEYMKANGVNVENPFTFAIAENTTITAAFKEETVTPSGDYLFYESFNKYAFQGGRDNDFSNGSGTFANTSNDLTWSNYSTVYGANHCIRMGSGSGNGKITSPVVGQATTEAGLSFDLAGWSSGSNTLTVTINNGGTFSDGTTSKSFTATNSTWNTFTETLKDLTANTTITFSGKRFFLDEIKLTASEAAAYTITITQPAEGGTISASAASANENEEVTLTSNPATGYEFTAWDVKDASNNAITVTNNKFIMPASNVTITATFSKINYNIYRTITAQNPNDQGGWIGSWNENCTLPDGAQGTDYVVTSNYGKEVQFKAGNNEGYKILAENVSAKDANNNDIPLTVVSSDNSGIVFKFNMPASNVTISAYFTFYQPDMYLMGTANDQNWEQTYKMTYSNDQYTIRAYFAGQSASDPYGYFQFEGDGTRYASGATGDYWPISENGTGESHFGDEVPLHANSSKNFRVPAGIYDIVINRERNKVTVNPVAVELTFSPAAGSVYQGTTVTASSNLYTLLHAINSSITESSVTNEVSLDGTTFSSSVTLENTGSATVTGKATYGYIAPTATANYTVNEIPAGSEYTLVTDASELGEGAEYVIMDKASGQGHAMSTTQNSNNRGQTDYITINNGKIIPTEDTQIVTLEATTGGWYLNVGSGYLYAVNSSNHLKTGTNLSSSDQYYIANITIGSENAASIEFGTTTPRYIKHNSGSSIFSCYTTGQQEVYLFKKGSTTPPSDQVATPTITPGSTDATDPYVVYGGKQQITINCATSGATIYYTTDGTTPTTSSNQYSEPFDLTSTGGNVTVKAIAVKADMDDSEIATSYYRFTSPKAPTFDPATGAVRTEAFDVTISSEYDDAVIYYMLDPASAPTAAQMSTNGTLYENPVNVSGEGSHTIYAMVVRNGIKSSVVNATYTITSGVQPSGDGDYVKVTNAADLTDGEYLIVYEGDGNGYGPFAFNGALSNLDATPNTIDVEINDFTIPSTPTVDAAVFTFDAAAGTFMNASGVYIGRTSDANGLESGTTALTNTVSIDDDGNAVIISEGGAYLRYNSNSNQDKFRYFKSSTYSGQQPVALYKKVDNNTVKTPVITPGSMRMTEEFDATITCATEGATIYYTLDGTTPTTNSAVYNGPIHIERPTVTLSAIAVLDGEQSTVATAVYSGVWVYNLAEYNALAQGTENILFKNPVIVQYHYISGSGKSYIYVKDDTGCAYFHQPGGSIAQLENGDVIGAGFSGNKVADEMVSDEESNFFMLTDLANFAANGDKGLADPEHETVARIADATTGVALNNHYITIKKVKLSNLYEALSYGGAKYFDIDNEAHIGYNKFNIDWSVVDDLDAYYDITGIQTAYNNKMEFHPTEIVKWEESVVTLRQLCDEGVEDDEYTISNNLMCVYANGNSIWVKDDTGQSIWMTSPANGDLNFEVYAESAEGIDANTRLNQAYYDQSNWCEIKLASGSADASAFEGQIIKGGTIHGKYTDDLNPTLENVTLTSAAISSEGDYAPNYYMPANFLGRQACQNSSHSTDFGQFYFYMTPKPQEYAQIVWAVWDREHEQFIMSTSDNDNGHRFEGEFSINLSMNTGAQTTSSITDGYGYNFTAIIKKTESKDAGYMVYPLDLDEGVDPATAIESVVAGNGEVKSVKFYNVAGIESATPFQGINIVVTEYTDGARTTTKMLCR